VNSKGKFLGFGLALAVGVGAVIATGTGVPVWETFVLASLVVGISAVVWDVDTVVRWKRPAPSPEPAVPPVDPDKVLPRFGSRRWARAQYKSGNISMEELVVFCASHHIVPGDVDNDF